VTSPLLEGVHGPGQLPHRRVPAQVSRQLLDGEQAGSFGVEPRQCRCLVGQGI
jgi:hypothetical protein